MNPVKDVTIRDTELSWEGFTLCLGLTTKVVLSSSV